MLPAPQQRSRSGAPSDESGGPEPPASARNSSEPIVAGVDTSGSGSREKKYATPTEDDESFRWLPQQHYQRMLSDKKLAD